MGERVALAVGPDGRRRGVPVIMAGSVSGLLPGGNLSSERKPTMIEP